MEALTNKTVMVCKLQSGETATYEPQLFSYDIFTRPGTDNKQSTKAIFSIKLNHKADVFLLN